MRKERRQKGENHHHGGEGDADADERAELGQAGQTAEIQNEKRRNGGDGRPENARGDGAADFRNRKFGLASASW